ncbi:MAG: ABC transporter permease, partial [Acidobacteriota bacterium]
MRSLFQRWVWAMAWRDSRGSRRRLLLYVSSIAAGVSALVAIGSFQANLKRAIEEEAKTLLGADLSISSRAPFSPEAEKLLSSLGGQQSRQVQFSSMAAFPNGGSRLVSVRAMAGEFPYYGEFETLPEAAAHSFRGGANALVEENLLLQFDAEVGDQIKLGTMSFRIGGRLQKVTGELPAAALISPRVYIPLRYLDQTGLIQPGSRALYTAYFKLEKGTDVGALVEELRPDLQRQRLRYDTIERRQSRFAETLSNLSEFLLLVGFVALILGCIGVASSIHLYVVQKVSTVAVLRCLGAGSRQALCIFLVQTLAMGLVGAVLGAAAGVGIQALLPEVLGGFLPAEIPFFISWKAIAEGVVAGG